MKNNKIRSLLYVFMITVMLFAFSVTVFAADENHAEDPSTPAIPANFAVAAQTSSTVSLKWDASEKATGYRVFRKTSKGWVKCVTTKKTTATVKKLAAAQKYTFAVRAYNKCVCGKITWSKKYVTINTATSPAKVKKVNTNSTTTSYKVTWTASKGATGYELYNFFSNKWLKFADTTKPEGSLVRMIPGKKYKLAVRPYIDTESGRVYGEYTTFTAVLAPRAPKVEASSPAEGKLKIKWSSTWGANGYVVYYKLGNGKYKVYKTYSKAQEIEISGLKGGNYTVAVRSFMKTDKGRIYSGFEPVKVTVKAVDPTPNCPHD